MVSGVCLAIDTLEINHNKLSKRLPEPIRQSGSPGVTPRPAADLLQKMHYLSSLARIKNKRVYMVGETILRTILFRLKSSSED